jgi:predicted transposase YbfD/YdcC
VDTKSNEITAIPELLDMLTLDSASVTTDAMGTQSRSPRRSSPGRPTMSWRSKATKERWRRMSHCSSTIPCSRPAVRVMKNSRRLVTPDRGAHDPRRRRCLARCAASHDAGDALRGRSRRCCSARTNGREGVDDEGCALARRLAVLMHRMWVDGTTFRTTREEAGAQALV